MTTLATIPFQIGRLFGQSLEPESVVGPSLRYATKEDIPLGVRYEGMVTWVIAEQKPYRLIGGVADINWTEENPNGIESITFDSNTGIIDIQTVEALYQIDISAFTYSKTEADNRFLSLQDTIIAAVTSNGVGTVGGINEGETLPVGMSFQEFLNKLLVKAIPAVYVQSTASISDNVAGTIEVGATFTPTLTITYNQNDSGASTEARFYRAGVLINTDVATPYQHIAASEDFQNDGETLQYSGQVDHLQGAQKLDNLGNPSGDPAVLVPARTGLATNTLTIYGRRRIFYGVDNAAPVGPEDVRAFGTSQFSTDNTFSINVINGTVSVEFGIPSHKTLVSVTFVGALTNDETANFLPSEQIVATNGAENRYPDNYKVYRLCIKP